VVERIEALPPIPGKAKGLLLSVGPQVNGAGVGLKIPSQDVEQGGLAGTVIPRSRTTSPSFKSASTSSSTT
jgi:hypothetical protein